MKQVYAVLALALVLVFALGVSAPAGILRGEDYYRPTLDDQGDDPPDGDHPWGGDQVSGDGGGYPSTGSTSITTISTGNLYFDLAVTQVYRLFVRDESTMLKTTEAKPSYYEPVSRAPRASAVATTSTRTYSGKVVAR